MNGRRLLSYLPVIILIIVAINQIVILQPVYKFSRWKGGGFGVYCRPYEYVLLTYLQVGDKAYLLREKGSPIKKWVNQSNEDIRAYSERFLNRSFLVDAIIEKGPIAGVARECSAEEVRYLTARNTPAEVAMRYIPDQQVEKVKIHLWKMKLLSHNIYSSKLIKTIVNEK